MQKNNKQKKRPRAKQSIRAAKGAARKSTGIIIKSKYRKTKIEAIKNETDASNGT